MEQRGEELGLDIVETTAHAGARPSHQVWQGKWFSYSGTSDKYPDFKSSTGYGMGEGLEGWNCRHHWHFVVDGVSKPLYTQEELDNLNNQTVKYNNKEIPLYEATQMQRNLEREIRADKRELAGLDGIMTSNTEDGLIGEARAKFSVKSMQLKQKENVLSDFSKQTGLTRDKARERLNRFDKSTSQKAVWSSKEVEKYDKLLGISINNNKIEGITNHFRERAIERKLTVEDIEKTLINPLKYGNIRKDKSQKIYGEKATVAINTETRRLITVYPTGEARLRKMLKEKNNENTK